MKMPSHNVVRGKSKQTLTVAAVQLRCVDGDISRNLTHAEPFVEAAASQGAELVLLPEFMPTGYDLSDAIWRLAEPADGPSVRWLNDQAARHSIGIGTSFLEASGEHFHNVFVLAGPDGQVSIRVPKSKPAAVEAFVFAGRSGTRVADTPVGRIGISICYEGFLRSTAEALHSERADLVLMPHSAPTPTQGTGVSAADVEEYDTSIRNTASAMAKLLGVPTVMANKVGSWHMRSRWPFPDEDSRFPGYSTIADADGHVLAQLGDEEGSIVCEVPVDSKSRADARPLPPHGGKWVRRPPGLFRYFVFSESTGRLRYALSLKRRRAAKRVSQT